MSSLHTYWESSKGEVANFPIYPPLQVTFFQVKNHEILRFDVSCIILDRDRIRTRYQLNLKMAYQPLYIVKRWPLNFSLVFWSQSSHWLWDALLKVHRLYGLRKIIGLDTWLNQRTWDLSISIDFANNIHARDRDRERGRRWKESLTR